MCLITCWPAGRVCTMQYLYSIYLAFSVVFSIFWSCNQLLVCLWCVLSFSKHSTVWKFLYGCIILFNILWHCNPQLFKLRFSDLQCGLYILKVLRMNMMFLGVFNVTLTLLNRCMRLSKPILIIWVLKIAHENWLEL